LLSKKIPSILILITKYHLEYIYMHVFRVQLGNVNGHETKLKGNIFGGGLWLKFFNILCLFATKSKVIDGDNERFLQTQYIVSGACG
jgi:hypothetical protein